MHPFYKMKGIYDVPTGTITAFKFSHCRKIHIQVIRQNFFVRSNIISVSSIRYDFFIGTINTVLKDSHKHFFP